MSSDTMVAIAFFGGGVFGGALGTYITLVFWQRSLKHYLRILEGIEDKRGG